MAKLELELSADLIQELRRLAQLHYGDAGDAALGRVVEGAVEMRLLWEGLVAKGGGDLEEPVSHWQFDDNSGREMLPDGVTDWMFKGGERG